MKRITGGPIAVNAYIVPSGDGTCFVVDPGAQAREIADSIKEARLACLGIALTHGHLDHTQAIPALLSAFGNSDSCGTGNCDIGIAIHELDAKYLGARGKAVNEEVFRATGAENYFKRFWVPLPEANILLNDGDSLFGSSWKVIHTPGHTDGSCCFYNAGTDELLSGDTLFADGIGRTDSGDDQKTLLESIRGKLFILPAATKVFPGHGSGTTIGYEKSNFGF